MTTKVEPLNPAQRRAVENGDGPLLILAGAGSGKTRVVTHRIAHLISDGVPANRILAVTFTNKAAGEMRERVFELVGEKARSIWVSTFHSACARILRLSAAQVGLTPQFSIYDADDQKRLMTAVFKDLGLEHSKVAPKQALMVIESFKARFEGPEALDPLDPLDRTVARAWEAYQQRLLRANAVDFGDLLVLGLRVVREDQAVGGGWARRWLHVLVDEFQDTNRVQYLLARTLSEHTGNLCVVGDDDQSIYSWRGADLSNILNFEADHPETTTVKLEQNYRSTGNILEAASSVIHHNVHRKKKTLWTETGPGQPIWHFVAPDERWEANYVVHVAGRLKEDGNLDDLAVFYRVHAQSRAIEEALRAENIPYQVVGGIRFYDRAEVKDLISYLRLIYNPKSDLDLLRVVNKPRRGIGSSTVKRAAQAAGQMGVSLFEALRKLGSDGNRDLGTAARRKVKAFVELMDQLIRLSAELEPAELAEETLRSSGYVDDLADDGTPTAQARMENLMELTGSIRTYQKEAEEPSLQGWLEQVALTADVDAHEAAGRQVTLMTVHAAKGLEFPEVIVTGLEEGLFPHGRGLYDPEELEEERRLAYVAFTRARRELHITRARSRWLMGQYHDNAPARFLSEIPKHLVKETTPFGRSTGTGGVPVFEDVGEMEWDGNEAVGVEEKSVGGLDEDPGWYEERLAKTITESRDEMYVEAPEFHVEEPPSPGAGGWFVGMEVRHKKFGVGRVQAWYGEPPRQKIAVYFPVHGHKTIVASYLEKN